MTEMAEIQQVHIRTFNEEEMRAIAECQGFNPRKVEEVRKKAEEDAFAKAAREFFEHMKFAGWEYARTVPKKILKNGNATIVFWEDGGKTVVKRAEGEEDNDYAAFTAALAIKLYGSNSRLKKMIEKKTVRQEKKKEPKTYPMFTCKLCRHSRLNRLAREGCSVCTKKHALVPDNATCDDWEQLPAKGMTTTVI